MVRLEPRQDSIRDLPAEIAQCFAQRGYRRFHGFCRRPPCYTRVLGDKNRFVAYVNEGPACEQFDFLPCVRLKPKHFHLDLRVRPLAGLPGIPDHPDAAEKHPEIPRQNPGKIFFQTGFGNLKSMVIFASNSNATLHSLHPKEPGPGKLPR